MFDLTILDGLSIADKIMRVQQVERHEWRAIGGKMRDVSELLEIEVIEVTFWNNSLTSLGMPDIEKDTAHLAKHGYTITETRFGFLAEEARITISKISDPPSKRL